MITNVFVYGTLKRGQWRERCWPCEPREVIPGWIRASLYTRPIQPANDYYPAIIVGGDRVWGEMWCFEPSRMDDVMTVLDAIEGTGQPGQLNLYDRAEVTVRFPEGSILGQTVMPPARAIAYFYARDVIADGFVRVCGGQDDGGVCWQAE